ncbi:MAG: hypothetical protein DRP56_09880 [Planctomycetota bacterium]|nr:MAG: hypothetical protein DRP56_09880 [Planctomycetota bacterium]
MPDKEYKILSIGKWYEAGRTRVQNGKTTYSVDRLLSFVIFEAQDETWMIVDGDLIPEYGKNYPLDPESDDYMPPWWTSENVFMSTGDGVWTDINDGQLTREEDAAWVKLDNTEIVERLFQDEYDKEQAKHAV